MTLTFYIYRMNMQLYRSALVSHGIRLTLYYVCFAFLLAEPSKAQMAVEMENCDKLLHNSVNTPELLNSLVTCREYYVSTQDTANILRVGIRIVNYHSALGTYHEAYDEIWTLMSLTGSKNYAREEVLIYNHIATLYMILEYYQEARQYLNKAEELMSDWKGSETELFELSSKVLSTRAWHEEEGNHDLDKASNLLLDFLALNQDKNLDHMKVQLAKTWIRSDKVDQADSLLKVINLKYQNKAHSINSLLFDYLGRLAQRRGHIEEAISYYDSALVAIEYFNNHLDNKVAIMRFQAECYASIIQYDSAYNKLRKASNLSEAMFGGRSLQNKNLFEIKNKYQEQLNLQAAEIQVQRMQLVDQRHKLSVLKYVIALTILITVFVTVVAYQHRRIKRNKAKQEEENRRQAAYIESKNGELMSAVLKLNEKDALLEEIRFDLSELNVKEENRMTIAKITNSIQVDKDKRWKEFELYFQSVHGTFYKQLKQISTDLTPTELKMCALIKMGLSIKDMADTMGIGTDGIKTSRSRIRKKLGLDRSANLVQFLVELE